MKIAQEDLNILKEARQKAGWLSLRAEKALLEAQIAETEQKNCILNIYVKYGLKPTDQFDDKSGEVTSAIPVSEKEPTE